MPFTGLFEGTDLPRDQTNKEKKPFRNVLCVCECFCECTCVDFAHCLCLLYAWSSCNGQWPLEGAQSSCQTDAPWIGSTERVTKKLFLTMHCTEQNWKADLNITHFTKTSSRYGLHLKKERLRIGTEKWVNMLLGLMGDGIHCGSLFCCPISCFCSTPVI